MKFLVIVLVCANVFFSVGQSNIVKGGKYLALKYGASKFSVPTFFQFEYGYAFKESMCLKVGGVFESGNVGTTSFNIGGFYADYTYTLFAIKNRLYGNIGLGVHSSLEHINSDRVSNQKKRALVYGAKASFELDYLLSQRFSLRYEFTEWYAHNSNLGNFYFSNTLGLVFILN